LIWENDASPSFAITKPWRSVTSTESNHFKVSKKVSGLAGWWLSPAPLKNMSSSNGMMTFATEWKVIKVMFQSTDQSS
jgi:hypothetical protein